MQGGQVVMGQKEGGVLNGSGSGGYTFWWSSSVYTFWWTSSTRSGDFTAGKTSPDFHVNQNMRTPLYWHSCWQLFHLHFVKLSNMIKSDMLPNNQLWFVGLTKYMYAICDNKNKNNINFWQFLLYSNCFLNLFYFWYYALSFPREGHLWGFFVKNRQ